MPRRRNGKRFGDGRRRQRLDRCAGVALVTVVFIMALMTTFAVYMVEDNHLSIRRVSNQRDMELAHEAAMAGEQMATLALQIDMQSDRGVQGNRAIDYYGETWSISLEEQGRSESRELQAKPAPLTVDEELGDAKFSVLISDESSKFNINNLLYNDWIDRQNSQNLPVPQLCLNRGEQYCVFINLLRDIGIDESFADAVFDWMDVNAQPIGLNGAEDEYYTGLEFPYRAANGPFTDISELALVRGYDDIDKEKREELMAVLTALPVGYGNDIAPVRININTASAQVLRAIMDNSNSPIGETKAKEIVEYREENGAFTDYESMINQVGGALGITFRAIPSEQLYLQSIFSFHSEYFNAHTAVKVGRMEYALDSTLRRYTKTGRDPSNLAVGVIKRRRVVNNKITAES